MTDDSSRGETATATGPGVEQRGNQSPDEGGDESDTGGLLSRRTVLAGTGGLVAGGVTFLALNAEAIRAFFSPTHESAGEAAWLTREEETSGTTEALRGTVQLDSGQYTAQRLWARSAGATLSWRIEEVDQGTVDVWVLPEGQLDRYRDDDDPRFNADLSETGVDAAAGLRSDVPDGDWWVVLDNSSLFGTDAAEQVEFDVELRITA